MLRFKRLAASALITATVVTGTSLVTATTASAASYHCKTSSASVDNPAYSGPTSDNYNFDVKLCAKRSGGYIYAYAKVDFEDPSGTSTRPAHSTPPASTSRSKSPYPAPTPS